MAKKVIYIESFYNSGAVQYAKGEEYPEDDNSARHVKGGIAEYVKEKTQTKAEKEAAEKQAADDKAAAELAKNQADEALAVAIKAKAIELSGLNAEAFEALADEDKVPHIEAATVALAE